jgi:hypothetical protein
MESEKEHLKTMLRRDYPSFKDELALDCIVELHLKGKLEELLANPGEPIERNTQYTYTGIKITDE